MISSLQNPMIKHFVHLRQNSDYRQEHGTLVIEGAKLVNELADKAKTILVSKVHLVPKNVPQTKIVLVSEQVMQKASGMVNPEGILAEVALPAQETLQNKKWLIALDGINDPGNLGTLLRTALALGWEGAFILPDTCDPFNEKALRASRGAVFRLPLRSGTWQELQEMITLNALTPIVADVNGHSLDEFELKEKILLVLSNEARGPSEEAKKACQAVTIPMPGEMESLNVSVAGGIMMYKLRHIK